MIRYCLYAMKDGEQQFMAENGLFYKLDAFMNARVSLRLYMRSGAAQNAADYFKRHHCYNGIECHVKAVDITL